MEIIISDYTTVKDTEVAKHLAEGWELYGSPLYVPEPYDELIQAMVKKSVKLDPNEPEPPF